MEKIQIDREKGLGISSNRTSISTNIQNTNTHIIVATNLLQNREYYSFEVIPIYDSQKFMSHLSEN